MNRFHKTLALAGIVLAVAALVVAPTLAQTETPSASPAGFPENTITVTGSGTVHGTPDIATVDVGVDVFKPTVSEGFTEANTKIAAIIKALTSIGIAAEDIQTNNLSVYSTTNPDPETGNNVSGYDVSNTIHVIVRDATKIENVIDSAINAGATSLAGLNFDIQDRTALETQARDLAMKDAAARAQNYASLINAQLGDAIVISENQGSPVQTGARYDLQAPSAANAVVAPGQTDVQIQVSVTYRIVR